MKYTTLGKTGKNVSILGMGGMRFNEDILEKDCINFIRYANEIGINYFDTAPNYNDDRSEDIYGHAFHDMPTKDFYIATKGMNHLTSKEIQQSIEKSLKRLKVDHINFYFLWCIITQEQFQTAKLKGGAIEGILKSKERGLIEHIGVSTHMYSDDIKLLVDEGIFEFIMLPYNALNFQGRDAGLRYAKSLGLGTIIMNPAYGGVIAEYKDIIKIYPDSQSNAIDDAMKFCLESPFIDITLSGMNSFEMILENASYTEQSEKCTEDENNIKQQIIKNSFSNLCTSCDYCRRHCPAVINIKSYMEIYNTFMLTNDEEQAKKRYDWFTQFGPLRYSSKATSCIECGACEAVCTQYLDITNRLKWIIERYENDII